ncbi:MAG: segregation/condensation protein A, partial [Clostridiales bacterium]|nr:segregation/condensation protein A [Clostridiales bacterium]
GQEQKEEIIVTFLAILELMRTGVITVTQEELFSDIIIESSPEALLPESNSVDGVL